MTDTREELKAVAQPDQLEVPGIWTKGELVHHEDPRDAQAQNGAAAAFPDQAFLAPTAPVGEVEAADLGNVALAAHVLVACAVREARHLAERLVALLSERSERNVVRE